MKKYKNIRVYLVGYNWICRGYFLSVDPAKDFYGDWYGVANEGKESFLLE
ncbi:Uncharacterised protein [Enterococcus casseliflavus]|nr:Uncharacterised protein [Enterococcus casseliflavus]